jgi:methionine-rich copper-binding protein CopC
VVAVLIFFEGLVAALHTILRQRFTRLVRGLFRRSPARGLASPLGVEWLESRDVPSNAIVLENQLQGTPTSVWDLPSQDTTVEGFATDISVNHGQTISFKVNDPQHLAYHIDIYRLGYYNDYGARLVQSIPSSQTLKIAQPAPLTDPTTGLVDAGNWQVAASWAVPSTAVTGVYLVNFIRDATGTGSSTAFVVRADESHSDLLIKTSDATWEAYNRYGGNSLYYSASGGPGTSPARAYAVSYNRPFETSAVAESTWLFDSEYPMLRWLEANGYDASYFTDVDTNRRGSDILNHKTFLSVGHDEYWSAGERASIQAARDAGVDLAFFSGNTSFWKTRWQASIDGSNTAYRTMVCYKETAANAQIDPLDISQGVWTGTWMDPRFSPPADGGRPENALTGTVFGVNAPQEFAIQVPYADAGLRLWRNTSIATLQPGQVATLTDDTLGEEWDLDLDNGFRPAGLFDLSSTTIQSNNVLLDFGSTFGAGTATHSLTEYRAPSGALVFSSATFRWSWGLDPSHDGTAVATDPRMQQATVNLLADMGAQPGSLRPGLVAATTSTDTAKPTAVITSLVGGARVNSGSSVLISGTASDAGGGVVAGVEVSTDNGATWHPAAGRASWSYLWTPGALGTATILARAVDDSGNLQVPAAGSGVTVTVGPPITALSIWGPTDTPASTSTDGSAIEVGVKFHSDIAGTITGIRFYKGSGNTGTHVAHLWDAAGNLLGTATFTGESASGWQQANFGTAVPISAGTTYVASYYAPAGHYSDDVGYFSAGGADNGPLHVPSSFEVGGNGVYHYAVGGGFPTDSFNATNYWVDVVLSGTTDTTPPTVASFTPASGATGVAVATTVTATFSEAVQANTISFTLKDPNGNYVPGSVTYNGSTLTATFTPTAALNQSTAYTATVGGAVDLAGNMMTAAASWSFTTGVGTATYALWDASATPAILSASDTGAIELGVKFYADSSGAVTGAKFYKGSGNTGTHVAHLWDAAGNLLATATFSGETASGWQQVNFPTPVSITPNATYVISYYAPAGGYSATVSYFGSGVDSGPLHALSNAAGGGNGVYRYVSGGGFPNSSYNASNYWVSPVFAAGATDTTPPTISARSPAGGATGVSAGTTVTATFSKAVQSGTISFVLKDANNNTVSATVTYDANSRIATLTPSGPLAGSATYTATVSGATDLAGNVMAPSSWSFTTGTGAATYTLWDASATPAILSASDTGSVELGVKFYANAAGAVTGAKFYKGSGNTGTHVAHLWDAAGNLLATATFSGETASGWQQVSFASPVTITPGATYVISYYAPVGGYSATVSYFGSGVDSGPLHALSDAAGGGNGVYRYVTGGGFPNSSYNASNYWVSPVFAASATDTTAPTVTAKSPANNSTGVAILSTVTATFSEPVQPGTISFVLKDANNTTVPGTFTYNAATQTATFTPNAALSYSTVYTATVGGATDLAGNVMATASSWSFTTIAATYTLWDATAAPAILSSSDTGSIELGVRFYASSDGAVTGARFYKGSANTGTHVAHLWDAAGNLLATATFTGETASGWQQVSFASPVPITPNAMYVISYYAPVGGYSATVGYFAGSGVDSGPLHAPSNIVGGGQGLYRYVSGGGFPNSSYNASNYWVSPVFTVVADSTPPTVAAQTPAAGATGVTVGTAVSATFSEAVQPATISFVVTGPNGAPVSGSIAYDAASRTATFTPASPLGPQLTYTVTVSGAKDGAGNTMTAVSWSFTTQLPTAQFTVNSFNGGTFTGTSVNANGALQLTPGLQDNFSGTQLDASRWGSTAWTGSPSITVSGGTLSLQGAQLLSAQSFVGKPAEGSISFGANPYQHFGLSAASSDIVGGNYWAVFSTRGTTDTLFANVNVSGTIQEVNLGALPTGFHTYRVEPSASGFNFYVDGTLKTTIGLTFPAGTGLRILLSSYSGPTSTALQAHWVRINSYATTGTYVSAVFDAGHTVTWGNASWTANVPTGTTVTVETMSSVDGTTWSSWAAVVNGQVASPAGRYFLFRITLTTSDPTKTPELSQIVFGYT